MPKWPDEAIELLRAEWSAGSSGQACADAINKQFGFGLTRNAVIGKAHRLGLSAHPSAISRHIVKAAKCLQEGESKLTRLKSRRTATQLKQTGQLAQAPLLTPTPADVVYYKSVPFFELESHHCRYAVSGDNGKEYQFCGNNRFVGSSYCAEHTRVTTAVWRR